MSAALAEAPAPALSIDARLRRQYAVEQFLYHEAALLDDRRIADWVALMTDDVRYVMPIRSNRSDRDLAREYSGDGELAFYDESKTSLIFRLHRLQSGNAWSESPPSRTRHLISNVRVDEPDGGELSVRSAFLLYRTRLERQVDIYSGERHDILRPVAGEPGFRIAGRRILLDQSTMLAANLSVFI